VDKVDALENGSRGGSSSKHIVDVVNPRKRTHEEVEEDELVDIDEDEGNQDDASSRDDDERTEAEINPSNSAIDNARPVVSASQAVQLPSIASWLGGMDFRELDHQHRPGPSRMPSHVSSTSITRSPLLRSDAVLLRGGDPRERRTSFHTDAGGGLGLLSPPGSGRIDAMVQPLNTSTSPKASSGSYSKQVSSLPSLRLPSPRAGSSSLLLTETPGRDLDRRTSPKWTPEDENVASLLLQISSSASTTSASPPASSSSPVMNRKVSSSSDRLIKEGGSRSPEMKKVQTPSALLGIEFSKARFR
jgi:hypothetical protein